MYGLLKNYLINSKNPDLRRLSLRIIIKSKGVGLKNCALTIVSGNYLAYARVLGSSLQEFQPDFDFRVLIVDRKTKLLEEAVLESGLNVMFAEDLGLPDKERLFYKYDIVELNTALKPTLIKQVFAMGYEHVLYLDPDIRVFASLDPVMIALQDADIVLTPHSMSPVMDGSRPSDVDFLRTGAYNLGFIGLKNSIQANAMLDWWETRCLGMGFIDPGFGIFVDQKWIDLVPSYFTSVHILRHPGCNVAYWNLHERGLSSVSGQLYANDKPLIYFHFSGVEPFNNSNLSKHQTRHKLCQGALLHLLVKDYCDCLMRLGHERYVNIPYGFGALDNGVPITITMRRAILVVPYGEESPFNHKSRLQHELSAAGITSSGGGFKTKASNTMTFAQNDIKVIIVNILVRTIMKIIGLPRLLSLLRYATLLTRESHLPAVLLKRPLDLAHKMRR